MHKDKDDMPAKASRMTSGMIGLTLWIALLGLAGCGGLAPQATPLPTRTPLPTFTPKPEGAQPAVDANAAAQTQPPAQQPAQDQQAEPAAQDQPAETPAQTDAQAQPTQPAAAPTDTPAPAPTATPAQAPAEVVMSGAVNIRSGPGTTYNLVGAANPNDKFRVTGKSPDGAWWQIDYNGQPAWVFGAVGDGQQRRCRGRGAEYTGCAAGASPAARATCHQYTGAAAASRAAASRTTTSPTTGSAAGQRQFPVFAA